MPLKCGGHTLAFGKPGLWPGEAGLKSETLEAGRPSAQGSGGAELGQQQREWGRWAARRNTSETDQAGLRLGGYGEGGRQTKGVGTFWKLGGQRHPGEEQVGETVKSFTGTLSLRPCGAARRSVQEEGGVTWVGVIRVDGASKLMMGEVTH